jgi:hypothetical protein
MDNQQQNKPPFARPPQMGAARPGTGPVRGQTGRLNPQQPGVAPAAASQPAGPAQSPANRSSLENSDSVQVSGQAGPARKDPPPVVPTKMGEGVFQPPGAATVTNLEDGARIVRYTQPQKLGKLLSDAKALLGGDSSRFYGKGWVIGQGIAKIAPDRTSVTYYPAEVAELVRDLLGPDSETL